MTSQYVHALLALLVLGFPNISTSSNHTYIISWIQKFLSSKTANFFDPVSSRNPALVINNLKPASLENVKYYVHYAFAAYCSDNLVSWTCTSCRILGPNVRYISEVTHSKYGSKAFFAIDDSRKEIVLAFRGGFNLQNLVLLRKFYRVRLENNPDISVHAGFYTGTMSLYSKVIKELSRLTAANPTYKVILTGHSKGAAEAAITTFLLKLNNVSPKTLFELYTYGEPRHGNREYATIFNSMNITTARVVNHADIIPHANSPAALGYVHRQNEVWIQNNLTRNCSTEKYEDSTCSNSIGPRFSIFDHMYYFDADFNTCVLEDPVNFFLQVIVNLKPYIPKGLLEELKLNMLNISPLSKLVIRPLGLFVRNALIH